MTEETVEVPRSVLERAVRKAYYEYRRAVMLDHDQPVKDPNECWAEFERLAEYLGRAR